MVALYNHLKKSAQQFLKKKKGYEPSCHVESVLINVRLWLHHTIICTLDDYVSKVVITGDKRLRYRWDSLMPVSQPHRLVINSRYNEEEDKNQCTPRLLIGESSTPGPMNVHATGCWESTKSIISIL